MPAPAPGSGSSLSVAGAQPKAEEAGPTAAPMHIPSPGHPGRGTFTASMPERAEGSFGMGVTGAIIGCLIGAGVWYFLALNVIEGWRILAWIPGIVGGFGALLLGKKPSEKLGIAAAVVAAIVTIPTQFAVIAGLDHKYLTEASEAYYKATMDVAKKAATARTDAQVVEIMDSDPQYVGLDWDAKGIRENIVKALEKAQRAERMKSATEGTLDDDEKAELAEYRKQRLPELVKLAKGDPSRTRFLEKEYARLKEEDYETYDRRWFWMGVWIYSSIQSAFAIGRGTKK
jgi:hypothetical protein